MENRRTAQKEATRRAIVTSAGAEFARHGYEGTTFGSIAATMGRPRSAIGYHQFPSKQHLASAVVETQFERWRFLARAAIGVPTGFPRLLSLLFSAILDARDNPIAAGAIRLLAEASVLDFALPPYPEAWRAYATSQVRAEINGGRLPAGTDAAATTTLLLSASFGLFEAAVRELRSADTERSLRDLWTVLLHGLEVSDAHDLINAVEIARVPPWPPAAASGHEVTATARGPDRARSPDNGPR